MNKTIRSMVRTAMIAAIYTALSLLLAPFSYGPVQVRVSEALTLLPVLSGEAIPGIVLGCALANAVGFATGANMLGFLDIIFYNTHIL